jgi:hypothetical protein
MGEPLASRMVMPSIGSGSNRKPPGAKRGTSPEKNPLIVIWSASNGLRRRTTSLELVPNDSFPTLSSIFVEILCRSSFDNGLFRQSFPTKDSDKDSATGALGQTLAQSPIALPGRSPGRAQEHLVLDLQKSNWSMLSLLKMNGFPRRILSPLISIWPSLPAL